MYHNKIDTQFSINIYCLFIFQALDVTEKSRSGVKSQGLSEQQICVIFAVCHATGMLSACANPIIYGFLNENFKTEFKEIYKILKSKLACCFLCCKQSENNNQN